MILNKRQSEILEFLKDKKRVTVKELATKFYVSEMTIRRDLSSMEIDGYLQRFNGGALISGERTFLPVDARIEFMSKQKAELSQRARKYLRDGAVVFLDSSSTCSYIIPLIGEFKDIKIITNSVQNLLIAVKYHIPCILAGGEYCEREMCVEGVMTNKFLSEINADVAFCSSAGITVDGVVTDDDIQLSLLRKIIMKNCDNTVFLLDESKVGKKFTYTICNKADVKEIIIV